MDLKTVDYFSLNDCHKHNHFAMPSNAQNGPACRFRSFGALLRLWRVFLVSLQGPVLPSITSFWRVQQKEKAGPNGWPTLFRLAQAVFQCQQKEAGSETV